MHLLATLLTTILALLGITQPTTIDRVALYQSCHSDINCLQKVALSLGEEKFGSYSPSGGGTYRLQSSIGTADTTVTLSSFKEPVSNIAYTMSYLNSDIEYVTLDPQSSHAEFASFSTITQNSDGTATLGGLVRGLSRTPGANAIVSGGNGCVSSTTLEQAHAGQSILIMSNPPCQLAEYIPLRTTATSSAVLVFGSTTIPRLDLEPSSASWNAATGTSFVTLNKLNSTAIAGAANATASVGGIVQLATALQAASSTVTGSGGQNDVLWSKYATDTPQLSSCSGASNGGCLIMTNLLGNFSTPWFFGVATSSPGTLFSVAGVLNFGTTSTSTLYTKFQVPNITATNTAATSSFTGFIANDASTTNLQVGNLVQLPNSCVNCTITGAISTSTTFSGPTTHGSTVAGTVYCVAPKVVSGGGYTGANGDTNDSANYTTPVFANGPSGTTGWTVSVACAAGSAGTCNGTTVTVYAICVNP